MKIILCHQTITTKLNFKQLKLKMKKLLLLTLLIFLVTYTTASSQTEKGKYLVGAASNMEFRFSFEEPDKELQISMIPQAGYFVADQFALGISVPARIRHYFNTFNVVNKTAQISVGPFLRYYFGKPKKLMPFVHTGFDYGLGRFKQKKYDENRPVSDPFFDEEPILFREFGAEAGFGLSYFITPAVGVTAQLRYEFSNFKIIDEEFGNPTHDIEVLFGFTIFL